MKQQHNGQNRYRWLKLAGVGAVGIALTSFIVTTSETAGAGDARPTKLNTAGNSERAPELVGGPWINSKKPIKLADRRGKVTVVQFWTFACSNCLANLPSYARWDKKFADRDVEIIGIHTPEFDHEKKPENVARRVKELGIEYPILIDSGSQNWQRWKQRYWPTIYLIDKQGRVRYQWIGELEHGGRGGEAKVAAKIDQLLRE